MHLLSFVVSSSHLVFLVLKLNTAAGVSGLEDICIVGGTMEKLPVTQSCPHEW